MCSLHIFVLRHLLPGFNSQPRRGRVTVLGKLFTPIVPLFTSGEIGSSPLKGCGGNSGHVPLTPVRPGHGNCRNPRTKKLEMGWGRVYRIILVKQVTLKYVFQLQKYISKLNKKQITCHVFSYVFQILVFQLHDNFANKHAEQPSFSHALPAARAV